MLRSDLVRWLDLVSPAIASADLVPILSHIWLMGDEVMAYNDQIAIKVPCQTGVSCAVPGDTILSLLKNSRAKEVELTLDGPILHVKAASSRFKLAVLGSEDFVFEMPKPQSKPLPVKWDAFLDAIGCCMRSVSVDTSIPDQLGISLQPKGSEIHLYSTNNTTISHAKVTLDGPCPFNERVVLSAPFCKQMLDLSKDRGGQLYIANDHSLLAAGKVTLFGRLIEVSNPIDFDSVINYHLPKDYKKKLIPVPSKLQLILERAIIITDSGGEKTRTSITVSEGKMRFFSKSGRGEISDVMRVDGHPDVSTKIEPRLLKNGYGSFSHFLITDRCAIMAQADKLYLIATVSE